VRVRQRWEEVSRGAQLNFKIWGSKRSRRRPIPRGLKRKNRAQLCRIFLKGALWAVKERLKK
jgi:hypothetical protein